jgi:hypothetical protein
MLAQQYLTGEQAIRVVASGEKKAWVKFDRDYISGEFDFEVEGGSTQPTNESFRRQSAMQIMDAMAPFIQSGIIDLQKLAQYVLQYGFGVKQPSMFMSSAPPPQSEPAGPPEQMEQMPQGMPPMPPQGMAPQGLPPEAMMQGGPPVGGPPPGLPPELAQLPPELLMQLLQGGGIPEGMPPGMPPGM